MAESLEHRAEYIRTFASHVSHEFKSPLTAIQGAAELIADHGPTMSEAERAGFITNISQDAGRLTRLVERLLALARADTLPGGTEGTTDVAGVLREVCSRADDVDLEVHSLQPGEEGSLRVAVDEETLDSIFMSLLDNARQHGGGRVRLQLRGEGAPHSLACIRISDDGPGITPENAARIFEPFFTTARDCGGTGLGLAIVSSLIRAHGGTIALLPSEQGAIFEVRLPATSPPERPLA